MAKKLTAKGPTEGAAPAETTKKGRKAKAPEPARSYTEEQKREALEMLEAQHNDMEAAKATMTRANGRYRKQLKETAKILGKETADLVWLLAARKREPEDIDRETRRRNELARFAGLKIGTQLGMFEAAPGETRSIGDQVERDAHMAKGGNGAPGSTEAIERAKSQGDADGRNGKGYQNFYDDGSPEFLAYKASYEAAQIELAGALKGDDDQLVDDIAKVNKLRAKLPKTPPAAQAAAH
ncbi:MAG: hypothetical protein J0H39_13875 [Alphaproteobacteria bacterium]|nr:hypothetical protein [Alphaproteobacteria bacterium]